MPSLTRPTTAHHRMPHRLTYTARRTFSLGRNLRFFRGDTRRSNERSRLGDGQPEAIASALANLERREWLPIAAVRLPDCDDAKPLLGFEDGELACLAR